MIRLVKEQLVKALSQLGGRAFHSNLSFRQALFSKIFLFYSPLAPTFSKNHLPISGGAFYSVQILPSHLGEASLEPLSGPNRLRGEQPAGALYHPGRESANPDFQAFTLRRRREGKVL
ncbi:hypothetical protein ACKU3Z_002160 [Pseudomonas aeruginosa]